VEFISAPVRGGQTGAAATGPDYASATQFKKMAGSGRTTGLARFSG